MNKHIGTFLIVIIGIGIFFLGGYSHEKDLSRNFNNTGDAGAWVFDIIDSSLQEG